MKADDCIQLCETEKGNHSIQHIKSFKNVPENTNEEGLKNIRVLVNTSCSQFHQHFTYKFFLQTLY